MIKALGTTTLVSLFIAAPMVAFLFGPVVAHSEEDNGSPSAEIESLSRDTLAEQIQEKTKQLEGIDVELKKTRQDLEGTQKERRTLQRDLNSLQTNVNQLNLNIRADKLRIQKLGLEIGSLSYDLRDIQESVVDKKATIGKVLLELQKSDRLSGNLLIVFLKSSSLAEGILEVQALKNLQNRLTVDVVNLRSLHDKYNEKIQSASDKKTEVAFNQKNLEYRKLIVEDKKGEQQVILTQTKNQESTFQRQLRELEELQKQIASEVESLGAVLRTKIDPALLPPLQPGVLTIPIDTDKENVTQDYGSTNFAKSGYRGQWHNGIDIRASVGTPVLAAEDGAIVSAGNQDSYCYRGAYGRFVVVNHPNNLTTMYAHMSRIVVEKGETVKRGQVIGYSGSTGYATGPHLHFTVFAQPTFYMGPSRVCGPMPFGGDLNPLGYL